MHILPKMLQRILVSQLKKILANNVNVRSAHNYKSFLLRLSVLEKRHCYQYQFGDPTQGWLSKVIPRFYRIHFYSTSSFDKSIQEWKDEFCLKDPDLDWKYLCETDLFEIETNVKNRKGGGNINTVRTLWKKLQSESRPHIQKELRRQLIDAANIIPNTTRTDSPIGDETEAKIVDILGSKRNFNVFKPKTVTELGENLGLLRTDNVTVSTGMKTYYFKHDLAKLENVLVHYTLQHLLKHGFEIISVPDILHSSVIEGCGFKTEGERNQVYKIDGGLSHGMCLAGTAEMPLAANFINEEMDWRELPKKCASVSRCYRAETSSLEEEKGIYRVHQFTKVEMFVVTTNDTLDEGEKLLQEMIAIEKELFQSLGLHFRVLDMPTQELGSSAHQKFDMEAWMPAKRFWGEISSTSNCTDFQTRRLNIKYRDRSGNMKFATTVNGTACAVPRTVMAIFENYQEYDGTVVIPNVLLPYFGNRKTFSKERFEKMIWTKSKKVKNVQAYNHSYKL